MRGCAWWVRCNSDPQTACACPWRDRGTYVLPATGPISSWIPAPPCKGGTWQKDESCAKQAICFCLLNHNHPQETSAKPFLISWNPDVSGIDIPGARTFYKRDYLENYGASGNERHTVGKIKISCGDLSINAFCRSGHLSALEIIMIQKLVAPGWYPYLRILRYWGCLVQLSYSS